MKLPPAHQAPSRDDASITTPTSWSIVAVGSPHYASPQVPTLATTSPQPPPHWGSMFDFSLHPALDLLEPDQPRTDKNPTGKGATLHALDEVDASSLLPEANRHILMSPSHFLM